MADRLKNILRFNNVAAGVQATLPHELNVNDVSVLPDKALRSNGEFSIVSVTATDVTVQNGGSAAANCDVLVEHWHTIDRVFGAAQTKDLVPQPFVAAAGGAASPSIFPTFWAAILSATVGNTSDAWFWNMQGNTNVYRLFEVPTDVTVIAISWCGQSVLAGGATTALAEDVTLTFSGGNPTALASNGTQSGSLTGLNIPVTAAANPLTVEARNDGPGDASAHQYQFTIWMQI